MTTATENHVHMHADEAVEFVIPKWVAAVAAGLLIGYTALVFYRQSREDRILSEGFAVQVATIRSVVEPEIEAFTTKPAVSDAEPVL